MKNLAFAYCSICKNLTECTENHWVITMDKGNKIQGFENMFICDNYEKNTYFRRVF